MTSSRWVRGVNGLIVFVLLTIAACTKDKTGKNCIDLSRYDDYTTVNANTTSYNSVSFNPNNVDELLFLKNDWPAQLTKGIYTYNLITKQVNKIYGGDVFQRPLWGKDDWIVFGLNGKIYQLKSNGDSLMQNPFIGYQYSLCWSPDGKYILGFVNTPGNALCVIDRGGNFIRYSDTVSFWDGAWNDNNIIASLDYSKTSGAKAIKFMQYPQLNTLKTFRMFPDSKGTIHNMEWKPHTNKLVWSSTEGIYITDFDKEQTSLLFKDCEFGNLKFISVNADGTKIAGIRTNYTINKGDKTIGLDNDIYIYDLTTGVEERVDLPK